MPKLILNRSSEFSNRIRSYQIYLDNQKIGEINDGDAMEFEIAPGKHQLKAKIDWCSSKTIEFAAAEGQTLRFRISGTNPILGLYYITIGFNRYLTLEQE